jgi:hypothetical protein
MENKKIIDYIVICDSYLKRLQSDVLKKINEGYVLVGGVSIGGGDYRNEYAQAMVKYDEMGN